MANYFYNGVELPALPETTQPYAVVFVGSVSGKYCCDFSESEATVTNTGTYSNLWTEYYQLDDGVWVSHSGTIGGQLVWANYNVYVADNENYGELAGTIYLAASDPIPVNPAPTLDPTALLMCWQVGNRIRQRGGA